MYLLSRPAPSLAPYIEHYWHVRAEPDAPLDLSVDVFVDARADLIFNFGEPYVRTVLGARGVRVAASNLDAQRLSPIRIEQRGAVYVVGVRFRSAGLAPFVRSSLDAFNDRAAPIVEVFGGDGLALERALREADTDGQRAALDRFFTARVHLSDSVRTVLALEAEIAASHGLLKIEPLCESRGASRRSIDRMFRRHVGFGPKTLARVARFQRALSRLKTEPECTLAQVSEECGYYDQPHFVREFKRFAGAVPTRQAGYFPAEAPQDFSPNLVRFVQDPAPRAREPRDP